MQINPVMTALNTEPAAQKATDASAQVLKKALDAQKAEGQAAVNLIEQAPVPVNQTAEIKQPVVRNGKIDTFA
jgi:hypothetical protein